jgi:Bifunctional DNA primase/polymerase, N-terminal
MGDMQQERSMQTGRQPEQASIPMVQHALSYARNGWPVFPLAGKVPYKETRGYKDATTDPLLIEAAWASHPTANIGLPTGAVSGLIVVDIDPRHNGNQHLEALQQRYGKLPATRLSRTAHGGIHRLYQHPRDGNSYTNAIELDGLSGIDIRGDGGYIVLPPSKLYGKLSYRWVREDFPIAKAPVWLLTLITKAQHETIPHERRFAAPTGEKWFLAALQRAREGNRNQVGFQLACQLRDDGVSEAEAREIVRSYAAQVTQGKTPYTEREALASVRSAYKRPPREPARRT